MTHKNILHSAREVGDMVGLHERTIRRLVHRLDLPVYRSGIGRGGGMWVDAGSFLVLLPVIRSNRRVLYAHHRQRTAD